MGACPHPVWTQRQARLGPLQCLALALFVATKHQRAVGWIEIESDHIPELRLKILVIRDLESPRDVRLDVVGTPQTLYCVMGDTFGFGHGTGRPLCSSWRRRCGLGDDLSTRLGGNRRLATGTVSLSQTGESALHKATFPFCDNRAIDTNQVSRLLLAVPFGAGKDDPRSPDFPLGCLGSFDHGLEVEELDGIKRERADRTGHVWILHVCSVLYS